MYLNKTIYNICQFISTGKDKQEHPYRPPPLKVCFLQTHLLILNNNPADSQFSNMWHLRHITSFLFILTGWNCTHVTIAQNQLISDQNAEVTADSLALIEKHDEAVELYQRILNNPGKDIKQDDKNRLLYKTGNSLMHSGKYRQAQPWFRKAIKEAAEKEMKSDALTGLGRTYEYTGKRDSAFYFYLEAFMLVEGTTDTLRRARGARNMAQLLRVLRRFDEARQYCRRAIRLIPGIADYKIIANIYNETAYLFELSGNLDSAAYFYQQLTDLSKENGYLKGESVGYSNMASVLEKQNRYNEALELKIKGLEIDRQIGDTYGMMSSYRGMAETYALMKNPAKGIQLADKAYAICDTGWISDLSGIHRTYYQLYKLSGSPGEALRHFEKHIELLNRINENKSRETVMNLLTEYESEKKEQQILLLSQANQLKENRLRLQWLIIGTLVLSGLLISITGWSAMRIKNQKLKQMRTELQHFLVHEKKEGNSNQSPHEIYADKWGLTSRESEILYHLGQGCPYAKIAEKLFISENTVKFHIKNIYIKLNVKNRMEALLLCSENKTLPDN